MVLIVSVLSFMKFAGQTSKNIHDIRKVCLQTTLCVLSYFINFYFFLDEIDMGGPKLEYEHIRLEMSEETSPRTIQRSLRKDPFFETGLPKIVINEGCRRGLIGQSNPIRWDSLVTTLSWEKAMSRTSLIPKQRTNKTVRWFGNGPLFGNHL